MSSKFRSPSSRNKTPPVCQKHKVNPSVPLNHLAAILSATITVHNPTAAPGQIWTRLVHPINVGPPGNYTATELDDEGRTWGILFSIFPDNTTISVSVIVVAGPTPPPSASISTRSIMKPFPLDTGQLEADTVFNADRMTLRVTL